MTKGEKIIKKATKYKGRGGSFIWDYFPGLPTGASWCVGFVLYILIKRGLSKYIYDYKKTGNPFWLPTIEEWLHKHATHVKMADAQPGDIVIFTWDGGGNNTRPIGRKSRDHIGFIRKKGTAQKAFTIEGNTSGGIVDERERDKTYIFAIYRLDCCKEDNSPAKEEKPVKTETRASGKALDLSAYQDEISKKAFKEVKAAGYDKVILRASYTRMAVFEMYKDKVFDHNIKTAHAAGLQVGVYHYSQATSQAEAHKEAAFILKVIEPYRDMITEPVVFDWEWGSRLNARKAASIGKAGCTKIAKAFCEDVKAAGYEPMIYASYSVLVGYLKDKALKKKYKIWVAHYTGSTSKETPYEGWYMWQYSSTGRVPGLSGNIDVNVYRTPEREKIAPKKTTSGLPIPKKTVRAGDTGPAVKKLKAVLNWACEGAILQPLDAGGIADEATVEMVKLFQDVHHLKVDGVFGPKTAEKVAEIKMTPQLKAINWAVSVARDNSFAYGTGDRAHHNGCYFCGTNITGPKKAKKGSRWEKTYCCNPFVHAAYAHGARIKDMLRDCKKAHAAGMLRADWTKYKFAVVGPCSKIKLSDMKAGDVVITQSHVLMYTGGGWLVEASGGGWGAGSIAHKHDMEDRLEDYAKKSGAYVLRYKGK